MHRTKKPAEAEAELRRAVAMAADVPEPWLALVQFLAATALEKAEAVIREAQAKLPSDQAPLVLARCEALAGYANRAEERYRAALAVNPDDVATLIAVASFYRRTGKHAQAEPLLGKILDPKTGASGRDAAQARRDLAMSLAIGGDPSQYAEALQLLDRNLRAGSDVEDRRVKAILLASRPSRRWEAIRAFEALAQQSPPTPDEKFVLAQLHARGRDWASARKLMLDLVATDGENPLYLAAFARQLLAQGQVEEADPWIAKLEEVAPKSSAANELKARRLEKLGRGDEAVALLLALAKGKDANIGSVAALLEELGHPAEAEALYRKQASRTDHPEGVLTLIAFLARQGQPGKALDLCDQAWQTCPPEAIGTASVHVLNASKAGDEHRRRVERRLDEAIRRHPDSLSLRFDLASLRTLQGRYDDVEAIYREILRRSDPHPGPYNNLALLLALEKDGHESEALGLVSRAIAIAGPGPDLLDTRALVYLALGQTAPAIKDLKEALSETSALESARAVWYFHMAQARLMNKDRNAAVAALRDAKAAGLSADLLHPLERAAYDRLRGELDREDASPPRLSRGP